MRNLFQSQCSQNKRQWISSLTNVASLHAVPFMWCVEENPWWNDSEGWVKWVTRQHRCQPVGGMKGISTPANRIVKIKRKFRIQTLMYEMESTLLRF